MLTANPVARGTRAGAASAVFPEEAMELLRRIAAAVEELVEISHRDEVVEEEEE